MKKYWTAFVLMLSHELIYRTNIFFGCLGQFVTYAALLFLFQAIPRETVGVYDQSQLFTYLLGAAFLSMTLFVYLMHDIAREIVEGDLINYLLRPIDYLWFSVSRALAIRVLPVVFSVITVLVLFLVFSSRTFFWQTDLQPLLMAAALSFGSLLLVLLMDFCAGMFGFWTHRSHGPRWMITMLLSSFAGSYFPLDLFPPWLQTALSYTPFPSIIFIPVKAYLGQLSYQDFLHAIVTDAAWIVGFLMVLVFVWRRGVKMYEAYGH
jgi:ABC-2 type transport system permease protein